MSPLQIANLAIAVPYFVIPVLLLKYIPRSTPVYRGLIFLFAAFVWCCGVGHLLASLGHHWAWWSSITATVSWLTAIALYRSRSRLDVALDRAETLELVWRYSQSGLMVWEFRNNDFYLLRQNPGAQKATEGMYKEGDGLCKIAPNHLEHNPDLGQSLFSLYQSAMPRGVVQHDFYYPGDEGSLAGWWRNQSIGLGGNRVLMLFLNITEDKEREAALERLVMRDQLTGAFNRPYLENFLLEQLHTGSPFALLFIDLNKFKFVNDTYGHIAGDQLLKEVADRIQSAIFKHDVLARIGGDEFIVFLRDVEDEAQASIAAERISDVVSKPWSFEVNGQIINYPPSIAIGVSIKCQSSTVDSLIHAADQGMYCSKKGSLHFCFADPAQQENANLAIAIAHEFPSAVSHDELRLYYQRIVRLSDNETVGHEALIRWQHPEHGLMMPGQFLDIVRSSGQMERLTAWVIQRAVQDLPSLPEQSYLAVNICSSLTAEQILRTLHHANGKKCLAVELTEDAIAPKEVYSALKTIQSQGFLTLLDDFLTGCSSVDRATKLQWSAIKIDRAFCSTPQLLPGIVSIIHAIGAKAILEGIEPGQDELLQQAIDAGVDYGQGYLWGRAKPLEELDRS